MSSASRLSLRFLGVLAALQALAACSNPQAPSVAGGPSVTHSDGGDTSLGGSSSVSARVCGQHDTFLVPFVTRSFAAAASAYEGPAIVANNDSGLVLAVPSPEDAADAGAPVDSAAPSSLPPQTRMTSARMQLPKLPLGARIWLSKTALDAPGPGSDPRIAVAWSLWIRDQEGGRVLFGASAHPLDDAIAPLTVDHLTAVCETGGTCNTRYSSVDLHGDSTVTLGDSETGTVRLGGNSYQARVQAQAPVHSCGDEGPIGGVSLELTATDLSALSAQLELTDPPTN